MIENDPAYFTMKAGSILKPEKLKIYSDRLEFIRNDHMVGQQYIVSLPIVHVEEIQIVAGFLFKSIIIKSSSNCHFRLRNLSSPSALRLKRIIGK